MRQLLQNLIGNGLKFHRTDVPPVVKLSGKLIRERGGSRNLGTRVSCQIVVEDNGIGFDEKYLERIFQPFQRLHGRNEYEGTGIGLTICQRIVDRHGGNIMAKSAPNKGAVFVVNLPARRNEAGDLP
jgi:signal transduction histidine kinase